MTTDIKVKLTATQLQDLVTVSNAFTWQDTEDMLHNLLKENIKVITDRLKAMLLIGMLKNRTSAYSLVMTSAEAMAFYYFWQMKDTYAYKAGTVIICSIIKDIDKMYKNNLVLQHS